MDNEAELLLKHLSGEAKSVFEFAIETAMRRGELLSLEWKGIDLKNCTATLKDTKNGEVRAAPLSTTAIRVLKGQTRGIGGGKAFTNTQSAATQCLGGR